VKGKTIGTQTNAGGEFSIQANEGDLLLFTYTGYVPQQWTVSGTGSVNLVMKPDASRLGEVVVIGYGTQKRKEVTGAVSTVNARVFEHSPTSNVATVLQGNVPG
jgi:hypothetical protein